MRRAPKRRATTTTTSDPYRSGLERLVARGLEARGVPFEYEPATLSYTIEAKYLMDFRLPNGVIVEAKGYFPSEDRRKMRRVKECNPGLDIRLVFSKPHTPISKGSKTTYAMWAEKHGFPWAAAEVPKEWTK